MNLQLSKADIIIQTIVLVVCLYACWAKWGAPLWQIVCRRLGIRWWHPRRRPALPPKEARLLTELFLQDAAQRIFDMPPPPVPTDVPAPEALQGASPAEEPELDDDDAEEVIETGSDTWEEQEEDDEAEPELPPSVATPTSLPVLRPVYLKPVPPQPLTSAISSRNTAWEQWMARVLKEAIHLIVIGQTNAGKTTVLQVLVESLVGEGLAVVVCDPDAAAGDWPGTEIHGGGDDFEAISRALSAVQAEARFRREQRALGQRTFTPLWVVLDEYADIKDECPKAGVVVENLLRRARKLNIHLVIGVQDTQVKTMGFERRSQLLQNARTVTLRIDANDQRYAVVDDEAPIRIPFLEPRRGEEGPTTGALSEALLDGKEFSIPMLETDEPPELNEEGGDKDDKIREMLSWGKSYGEIARALRVATTRISKVKKTFMLET